MSYANTSITINFDEWIDKRKEQKDDHDWQKVDIWIRDFQGLYYLDRKCNLSGFMNAPHATYRNNVVMATSHNIDSLEEFILHCEGESGEKHIFLYDLHYNVGMPKYYTILDPMTFEPEYLDTPIEHESKGWRIRYGEI
jgi:hypothetical protein